MLHKIARAIDGLTAPVQLCFKLGWGACFGLLIASLTASFLIPISPNYVKTAALAVGCIEATAATFFVTLLICFICHMLIKPDSQ